MNAVVQIHFTKIFCVTSVVNARSDDTYTYSYVKMTISQDLHPPTKHCLYAHHIVQSQKKYDLRKSNVSSMISELKCKF